MLFLFKNDSKYRIQENLLPHARTFLKYFASKNLLKFQFVLLIRSCFDILGTYWNFTFQYEPRLHVTCKLYVVNYKM